MRRIVFILPLLLACSQTRESEPVPVEFFTEDTRAFQETTTSNLNGFYVTARNTSGKVLWENVPFVQDEGGNRFTGGMYWPQTGALSFYAISHSYPQTVSGNSVLVQPSPADGDVVSAAKNNASNGTTQNLYFGHVFAALDGVVFTPDEGCTIVVKTLGCRYITDGTYDIASGSWTSVDAPGEDINFDSPSLENRGLGLLCVPGECIISASYECTFGGHTESCNTSATVTLPVGRKSTVSGTLQAASGLVSLSVTVTNWDEELIYNNDL